MIDNESPVSALDILGASLDDVPTSWPILEPGVVDFVVSEIKLEPTKAKNGHNLTISLKTAMPWRTREGQPKPAGFPMRDNIYIPSGENIKPEVVAMSKQKLAQFREAVTGSKAGSFNPLEQYIGKPVTARIKIEQSQDFGDSNRVVAYVRRQQ
jgi:hypothetical protein